MKKQTKLLWVDLETTGIDPREHLLLEGTFVVTDFELNELCRTTILFDPNQEHPITGKRCAIEELMDDYVTNMHTENGLLESLSTFFPNEPNRGIYHHEDASLSKFLGDVFGEERPWLAGSTINFDRGYLDVYLPETFELLHHRNLDVTSFRNSLEVMGYSLDALDAKRPIAKTHRSQDDIRDTMNQFKHLASLIKP